MCGIAGIVHWSGCDVDPALLRGMADALHHRGPDEEGFYFNRENSDGGLTKSDRAGIVRKLRLREPPSAVGLAHRRLSIIDLSAGQQPLCNEDATVWIVFNGEIYNFRELRTVLQERGHCFKTNSDTEIIVHAYEEWGVGGLDRLNGMFAFAIWNEAKEELFLARDRIGKKPLYYRAENDTLLFGSELKAILAYPGVEKKIDATAVADYFKYLYVPDPKTIYEGIFKLKPAHYLIARKGSVVTAPYWDISFAGVTEKSERELTDELSVLLEQAVLDRLESEVPLGAFLSGGVDSSGVVALMARQMSRPVLTCSIGFDDPVHNESHYAAEVAGHLGTAHNESVVRENFADMAGRLHAMFDEPFADSSALPTYYVCNMARRQVTVALSGDGGDETFAGYDKYVTDAIENLCGRIVPASLLQFAKMSCFGRGTLSRKMRTLTGHALLTPDRAFYETNTFISDSELESLLNPDLARRITGYDPSGYTRDFFNSVDSDDHLTRMLYTDLKTYLPGDILVKVDRMSMANSLEVRSPLLDYRLVEFAARLPSRFKVAWGSKKYLLKKAFGRLLPEEIFNRPKHGFSVPLDSWFRCELTALAEDAFFSTPEITGLLDVNYIRRIWLEHRSGRANRGILLWSILMFALWYRGIYRTPGENIAFGVAR